MHLNRPLASPGFKGMPVPVMLHMLNLIAEETQDDVVLAGVARTLSQAIDELSALQGAAMEVMREMDCRVDPPVPLTTAGRRRLC